MSKEPADLPTHVAIIMDGNGRWANKKQMLRLSGHKAGAKAAKDIVKHAAGLGIKVLSLFAFSSENWRRPKKEVSFLMDLFIKSLKVELKSLHENRVKLCFTGDISALSDTLKKTIHEAETLTQDNQGLILNVVFNYGGQWDILEATKHIARHCVEGVLAVEDITEDTFERALSMHNLPHPDLLVRTSGECRISNFFLWQIAYTELYFCECFWPDFSPEEFDKAIASYQARERRFGELNEDNS